MAENKTKATVVPVSEYLAAIESEQRRTDVEALIDVMQRVTGEPPVMWGSSIVGFGSYRYECGKNKWAESCIVGLSSRKAAISLYVGAANEEHGDSIAQLGNIKAGKGCLYVKKVSDIDLSVLEKIVRTTVDLNRERYP
jgi:hypothetical protein